MHRMDAIKIVLTDDFGLGFKSAEIDDASFEDVKARCPHDDVGGIWLGGFHRPMEVLQELLAGGEGYVINVRDDLLTIRRERSDDRRE